MITQVSFPFSSKSVPSTNSKSILTFRNVSIVILAGLALLVAFKVENRFNVEN
jgi:hypothetical protein